MASNSASQASRAAVKRAHFANSCGLRSLRILAASAANRNTLSSIATAGECRTLAGALAHGACVRLKAPTSSMDFIDIPPLYFDEVANGVSRDRHAPHFLCAGAGRP